MATLQPEGAAPTAEEKYARLRGVQLRDAVVFLVDWRHGMATGRMASGAPPLAEALTAIVDLMRARIVASEHDLFGVVAFGAGVAGEVMKDSSQTWKGVRVILPLEEPSAEGMMELKRLVLRLERGDAQRMQPWEEDWSSRPDPRFSFGEGPVEMQTCLWAVRYQFMRKKIDSGTSGCMMFNRQRCYVLTNDDDPVGEFADGGTGVQARAKSNAADLSEAGVSVEVTFLRGDGCPGFDASKFYNFIVYVDRDEYQDVGAAGAINEEGIAGVEEFDVVFKGKLVKKRTTARTMLRLEKGLVLGVGLYSTVRKAARPNPVKVQKSTSKRLSRISQTLCEWDGKELGRDDVRVNFDGLTFMKSDLAAKVAERAAEEAPGEAGDELDDDEDVDGATGGSDDEDATHKEAISGFGMSAVKPPVVSGFLPTELKSLGRVGEPDGMTLFGFRDVDKLRPEDVLKPPYFVYPDESQMKGSTKIFAALLDSMLRAKKMAIVLRSSERASNGPRFCALVPQAEVINEKGMQTTAPGMHLIPLPYKNDVYTGWEEEMVTLAKEEAAWKGAVASSGGFLGRDDGGTGGSGGADTRDDDEVVTKVAKKLVKRLRRKNFTVKAFQDPAIVRFYAVLEAELGVSDGFDVPGDDLEPQVERMRDATILPQKNGEDVDLLEMFKNLTVGHGFDASQIALLYGTKSGRNAKEVAVRQLKRKAEKDAKAEAAREDLCEEEYVAAAKRGDIANTFTAAKLKLYCVAFSLPVSGRKADLAQRVYDHINGPAIDDDEVV